MASRSKKAPFAQKSLDVIAFEQRAASLCHVNSMYNIPKLHMPQILLEQIRQDLTMVPFTPSFVPNKKGQASPGFYAFGESETHIAVPRFYGIEKFGVPTTPGAINVSCGTQMNDNVVFTGKLRTDVPQEHAYNVIMETLCGSPESKTPNEIGGAMAQLPCGYGKTVLAIAIAVMLHVRTIILVHKEFLMSQWIERIMQFAPSAKIGRLQQNIIEIDDCDFVVGMVHSVAGRDYDSSSISTFGFMIVDECHHMAAQFFSQAIPKFSTKYTLALTATPRRSDGLERLLWWSMGPIAYEVSREIENVRVLQITFEQGNRREIINRRNGEALRPQMINALVADHQRNEFTLNLLMAVVRSRPKSGSPGKSRKVIFLSDRLDHLRTMMANLNRALGCDYTYGLFIGGMSEVQRDKSATCDVIFGTYVMASEALDIPALDTIIFGTPKSDVEQAIGRILRPHKGKHVPTVIDILDPFSYYENQGWKRYNLYKKFRYNILRVLQTEFLDLDDWLNEKPCTTVSSSINNNREMVDDDSHESHDVGIH